MKKYVIIDFETLDTKPSTAITALSVLMFDPSELKSFDELVKCTKFLKFDWKEQIQNGRTTSEDTLNFWRSPDNKEAFDFCVQPKDDDISIKDLPNTLSEMFKGINTSDIIVYSRGNSFEFGIMDNIFESLGEMNPIPFWSHRDVRTEIDSIMQHLDPNHKFDGNINGLSIDGFIKHNPVHDCAKDVISMQYAHVKLAEKIGE